MAFENVKLWIASASCIIVLKEFDVDLDGAQTLRFLGYKVVGDQTVLLGKCALEVCSRIKQLKKWY